MRVVLATANPGKQREFAALLAPLRVELLLQSALGIDSAAETGATLKPMRVEGLPPRSNPACRRWPKTQASKLMPCRAPDHSARYAGRRRPTQPTTPCCCRSCQPFRTRRSARYRCVLALVQRRSATADRAATGKVASRRPAGTGSFGYDRCSYLKAAISSAQLTPMPKTASATGGRVAQAGSDGGMALTIPPLSYVHFPVRAQVPYCDSTPCAAGDLPVEPYLAALLEDLRAQLPFVPDRAFRTVFLGGGTPSLFPPAAIERLLQALRAGTIGAGCRATLEANRYDRTRALSGCRAAGINRVSLGAQSFRAARLRRLGRSQCRRNAARCRAARRRPANFNLDLMVGLPEQDLQGALSDVRQARRSSGASVALSAQMEPGTCLAAFRRGACRMRIRLRSAAAVPAAARAVGFHAIRGVGVRA
jgi:inosine/xanthosine triphosphate pyrophosphatase family protein